RGCPGRGSVTFAKVGSCQQAPGRSVNIGANASRARFGRTKFTGTVWTALRDADNCNKSDITGIRLREIVFDNSTIAPTYSLRLPMKTVSARTLFIPIFALMASTSAFAQFSITRANTPRNGEVGVAYPYPAGNGFQFTGVTTNGTIAWQEVTTGASNLPPGLSLTSNGVLGGPTQRPSQPGVYTFTVQATFHCDCSTPYPTDTASFTVRIFAPITITSSGTLPSGTVGQPYQFQFAAQGGDPAQYGWSAFSGYARKGPQPLARLQPRDQC